MSVDISLLGRFEVRLDGETVPASTWSRRHAAALVKILSLAPRRRLHREQVIDALWPDVPVSDAGPRLHKAAHYARRALGADSVVLRSDSVILFPDRQVSIDAVRFQVLAADALDAGDASAAATAAAVYGGALLPDDRYEAWATDPRERLELLHRHMLRQAQLWAELVELDPTDGETHLALMQQYAASGDRRTALRQFERMERALHRELGVGPSDEAIALRDSLLDVHPAAIAPSPLIGRKAQVETLQTLVDEASRGRGRTVFLAGSAGTGKSTLVDWLRLNIAGRGWRSGHGVASVIEGAWPYAPVLEALADLTADTPHCSMDSMTAAARTSIAR